MFRDEFLPTRRGFNRSAGYLQGCEAAFTHVAACCEAATPAADEGSPSARTPRTTRRRTRGATGGPTTRRTSPRTAPRARSSSSKRPASSSDARGDARGRAPARTSYTCRSRTCTRRTRRSPRFRAAFDNDTALTDDEKTMFGYISELDAAVGAVVDAQASLGRRTTRSSSSRRTTARAVRRGRARAQLALRALQVELWEGGVKVAGSSRARSAAARAARLPRSHACRRLVPDAARPRGARGAPAARSYALDGVDQWDALVGGARRARAPPAGKHQSADARAARRCRAQGGRARRRLQAARVLLRGRGRRRRERDGAAAAGGRARGPRRGPAARATRRSSSSISRPTRAETTDLSAEQPSKVDELLDALRDFAAVTVEPMQWVPPFQGDDYECAACALRNATRP